MIWRWMALLLLLLPGTPDVKLTRCTTVGINKVNATIFSQSGNPPLAVTIPGTTAGNLLVVTLGAGNNQAAGAFTITDGGGDTFHQAILNDTDGAHGRGAIFYAYNIAGGTTTVTLSGYGFTTVGGVITELNGIVSASDPLDLTATNYQVFVSTTTWTSNNSTGSAAQASELLVGTVTNIINSNTSDSYSAGTGWTGLGSDTAKLTYSEYQILTTASGQYAATGTYTNLQTAADYITVLASFKGK